MPYTKSPRPYRHEYQLQVKRGEHADRMERQRARREMDKADTGTVTKKSPRRAGKDIDHVKMLAKGGSNKDGVRLMSPSKNRARNGHSPREAGGKKPS